MERLYVKLQNKLQIENSTVGKLIDCLYEINVTSEDEQDLVLYTLFTYLHKVKIDLKTAWDRNDNYPDCYSNFGRADGEIIYKLLKTYYLNYLRQQSC